MEIHQYTNELPFLSHNLPHFDWQNYNELRKAISSGHISKIKQLISNGASVHIGTRCPDFSYYSPLHLAVLARIPEIVEILLDHGADTMCSESCHRDSPLTMAAKTHNNPVIDLLLRYDLQHHKNEDRLSHLHVACMRNRVDVVRRLLLLNQGSNINEAVRENSVSYPGFTALHFAVEFGSVETVEILLKSGADITAKDSRQLTPLHLANLQRHEKIIDFLLDAHIYEYTNPIDAQGLSHFHIACTRDNVSVVEHFLELGVDVNLKVSNEWRPITFAMFHECPNVIHALMKFGAHLLDSPIHINTRLLASAFIMKNYSIYDLTKSERRGFDGISMMSRRHSDLHLACMQNDFEKVQKLFNEATLTGFSGEVFGDETVSAVVDLNPITRAGSTPLHFAAQYNSVSVIDFLLDHGANIMAQDCRGKTPLHIAFEYNYPDVTNKIVKSLVNCSQNLTDGVGLSLFHILCAADSPVKLVENFIVSGIDVNSPVGDGCLRWAGFTPLQFALKFRQLKIIKLLLECKANVFIKNNLNFDSLDMIVIELNASFRDRQSKNDVCDIVLMILESISDDDRYKKNQRVTQLHALCFKDKVDRRMFEQYLHSHQDEINKAIELPEARYHKYTPLHLALENREYEAVEMLLENGADLLMVNGNGQTPIELEPHMFFGEFASTKVESFFLRETSLEIFNSSHFHSACACASPDVVIHILDHVPDDNLKMSFVTCRDDYGRTPLHSLLNECNTHNPELKEIAQLLLRNGSDIGARDYKLQTPFLYAEEVQPDIIQVFLDYGAEVNDQNLYGETLLHRILDTYLYYYDDDVDEPYENRTPIYGLCEKTILLLVNGADINLIDERGRTCLAIISEIDLDDDVYCLRDCAIILLKHVQKLKVIESFVSKENRLAYNSISQKYNGIFDELLFINECERELELMRSRKIDSFTTLRDILFANHNTMVWHCENTELHEMAESSVFAAKFPIYSFMIKVQLKKGSVRRSLLKKCSQSMSNIFRGLLPHVCIRKIIDHLSNADLNIIISN